MLNCIKNLKENNFGLMVLPNVVAVFGDLCEQITFLTILQNDKGAFRSIQNLFHRDYIGMLAGSVVQSNFTLLELPLPRVETKFVQGLNGILNVRLDVPSFVDGSIGSHAQNVSQLNPTGKYLA